MQFLRLRLKNKKRDRIRELAHDGVPAIMCAWLKVTRTERPETPNLHFDS
jgi:hypothetical protein